MDYGPELQIMSKVEFVGYEVVKRPTVIFKKQCPIQPWSTGIKKLKLIICEENSVLSLSSQNKLVKRIGDKKHMALGIRI